MTGGWVLGSFCVSLSSFRERAVVVPIARRIRADVKEEFH